MFITGAPARKRRRSDNGSGRPAWRRRPLAVVVLAALVALCVRLVFVLAVTQFRDLGFDAAYYDLVALELREGHGFVDPFALYFGDRVVPSALFPPAYPVALAAFAWLGDPTHVTHLVVSAVFGSVSVALVALVALRIGGVSTALVAGLLAAVHPMLFGADASLMAESLYGVWLTGALLLTYAVLERPTPLRFLALAVVVGAATLTRGEGLLLLALPLLAAARLPPRRALAMAATTIAVVLAVQLPWALRNHRTFDTWVLGSNNSATVVGGANCDATYHGPKLGSWEHACLRADREGWMEMSETELNGRIRAEGLRYARGHWTRLPVVGLVRVARTWGLYDPFDQMRLESLEGRVYEAEVAGWAVSLLTVPLAAMGFGRLRRAGVPVWPLVVPIVAVIATSVVTYGNQRFRFAAEPSLVIATAAFLVSRRRGSPFEARR